MRTHQTRQANDAKFQLDRAAVALRYGFQLLPGVQMWVWENADERWKEKGPILPRRANRKMAHHFRSHQVYFRVFLSRSSPNFSKPLQTIHSLCVLQSLLTFRGTCTKVYMLGTGCLSVMQSVHAHKRPCAYRVIFSRSTSLCFSSAGFKATR